MYSLEKVEKTAQSITSYVKASMKEKKLGAAEIKEYERQARKYDFTNLLTVSQEYIDMLNQMESQADCKVLYM